MQKKEFKDIFQRYFHNKYSFNNFLNTTLEENKNFRVHTYNDKTNLEYDIKNLPKSIELKNYHTFLNNLIFTKLNLSKNVYSYRENHTIIQMLEHHKNNSYFFKTDIKSFFNSITKNLIKQIIIDNKDKYNFQNLDENLIKTILNIVTHNDKLPAGFVCSPSISNAILYKFDISIHEYCKKNNIIYTRYSDDLIFSSKNILNGIDNIIEEKLNTIYNGIFQLNNTKSKYLTKKNKIKILGLIITPQGYITVPKEFKKSIQKLIYLYINNNNQFNIFLETNYSGKLSKAYGILNYINDIDIGFVDSLRKKYGNYVIDKFLHGKK